MRSLDLEACIIFLLQYLDTEKSRPYYYFNLEAWDLFTDSLPIPAN